MEKLHMHKDFAFSPGKGNLDIYLFFKSQRKILNSPNLIEYDIVF